MDDASSNASTSSSWITKLQQRQEQLAENRAELRRLLKYKREVTEDEKKSATMASLLSSNNKVPGDEWRARLQASERHLAFVRKQEQQPMTTISTGASGREGSRSPEEQQQQPGGGGARAASSGSVRFEATGDALAAAPSAQQQQQQQQHHHQRPAPQSVGAQAAAINSAAAAAAAAAAYSTSSSSSPPNAERGVALGGPSSARGGSSHSISAAAREGGSLQNNNKGSSSSNSNNNNNNPNKSLKEKELDEAALRIQLAKDHVKYVESIHQREDAIRTKHQQQMEHALLNEVLAAREECKKHVHETEMSSRNQEDLLRVITLLKGQLADAVKELEYSRKEVDFTGRECQVKKEEVGELRVELALTRKRLERAEKQVAKRDSSIEMLEREKADVLLDCKKVIKERKLAEDQLESARRDVFEQRRMAEEYKREALVPPSYRRGQPAPMVYEAHRKVSPSQHSQQQQQQQDRPRVSRSASASGSRTTPLPSSTSLGASSSSSSAARDVTLLRDLYADMASCPLLRKAVQWDTARAGPSALPIVFDRQRWESVKRQLGGINEKKEESSSLSQRQHHHHHHHRQQQQENEGYSDEFDYQPKPRPRSRPSSASPRGGGGGTAAGTGGLTVSQTTCTRCGHAHHCHHRCSYCTGHALAPAAASINTHTKAERAHVVRTKSPVNSKPKQQQQQYYTPAAVSSGAEASDEFTASASDQDKKKTASPPRRIVPQQQQQQQKRELDDALSSPSSDDDDDEDEEEQTKTRSSVGAPFRKFVSAHDGLAREARRGKTTFI